MLRSMLSAAAIAAAALPAAAGGSGCTTDCYRAAYVPPTYGLVAEKVMLRAPRTYALVTPPVYETVQETVMVHPGKRYWSVGYDGHGNKVGCWVTKPAQYASVARRVMVRGSEVVPYAQPAVYGTRTHSVMTSPGYKTWVPLGRSHGHGGYGHGGVAAAAFGGEGGENTFEE